MGGNIPSGNFLGGNFPAGDFPWGSLMGGDFPDANFPRGNFPRTYHIHLTNLNHFLIKQLTLAPTKMFRLPWLNEKNYPHGCFPIHLS